MVLLMLSFLLGARLVYLFLADKTRFPINTVKIVSEQKYLSHKELDTILEKYWSYSFFSLPVSKLKAELSSFSFIHKVEIERIWPDILKISLVEKTAIALWNQALITDEGLIFEEDKTRLNGDLPHLYGPQNKPKEVLQIYKKMSKILSANGLSIAHLAWRDNQAWDLILTNGVELRLGKEDLEKRIKRFCKAYPAVFGEHPEQLVAVDLRYPRGMAVEWKK